MSTPGYIEHKEAIHQRLRRIEGQARGLQRMVEDDRYCIDILDQIAAATRALQSVAIELLDDHIRNCVRRATTSADSDEKVEDAMRAIGRLVRS